MLFVVVVVVVVVVFFLVKILYTSKCIKHQCPLVLLYRTTGTSEGVSSRASLDCIAISARGPLMKDKCLSALKISYFY